MNHARHLKLRLLTAIASSGILAAASSACGGSTESDGSGGAGGSTGGTTSTGGTPSTGGTTSTGGTGGTAGATATCSFGNPVEQCFTLDQLESIINNPPRGGDVGDAGTDAWIELTDCAEMGMVQNTCCNPAAAGPTKKNGECCYVFCEGACCGRPFVVAGRARVAKELRRADWLRSEKLAVTTPSDLAAEGLDEPTRFALARAWLRDARMEHASIASFARFTLELLAVGAPADLVARAQRAGFDEVVHAELCFSMATRYSGGPLGPGSLDVSGVMPSLSLADCAADVVREGCIGETIAALMAREQSAVATDPDAARTLEHIASDEARHAELAWSFVRWAVSTGGREVQQRVKLAFRQGIAAARCENPSADAHGVDARAWRRHGRLDEQEARAVLVAALDEIIEPCQRGLFGPESVAVQAASV